MQVWVCVGSVAVHVHERRAGVAEHNVCITEEMELQISCFVFSAKW